MADGIRDRQHTLSGYVRGSDGQRTLIEGTASRPPTRGRTIRIWSALPRRLEAQSIGSRRKPLVGVGESVGVLLRGREHGGILQILDVGGYFPPWSRRTS